MIVYPGMLEEVARRAGMKVPEDPEDFDEEEYPHFNVFCEVQLCRPVCYHGEHEHNARVVAKIPLSKIKKVTLKDLIKAGLVYPED